MLKANEDGEHVPYESIWVEGYNQFTYKFKNGKYYKYYVVTNQDMLELERRISLMDYNSVTLEELQTLQHVVSPLTREKIYIRFLKNALLYTGNTQILPSLYQTVSALQKRLLQRLLNF